MKKVSVRAFQQKASIYLNDLPITLTIRNKPVAILRAYKKKDLNEEAGFTQLEYEHPTIEGRTRVEYQTPSIMDTVIIPDRSLTREDIKDLYKKTENTPSPSPDAGTPPAGLGIMPKEPKPAAYSVIVYCPMCKAPCWKEYANQHYMDNHEV